MYQSALHQFIEFWTLDGYIRSNGSLLPTKEHTLLSFCSHLADGLHHSSIKVYLSVVRLLHIDYGFPHPLRHCLQLQRLLLSTTAPTRNSRPHAWYSPFSALGKPWSHHALGCLLHQFLWFTLGRGVYCQYHLWPIRSPDDTGSTGGREGKPLQPSCSYQNFKKWPFSAGVFHLTTSWSGFSLFYPYNHGLFTLPGIITGGPCPLRALVFTSPVRHSSSGNSWSVLCSQFSHRHCDHCSTTGYPWPLNQDNGKVDKWCIPAMSEPQLNWYWVSQRGWHNNRYSSGFCRALGASGIWQLGALASPSHEHSIEYKNKRKGVHTTL